MRTAPTNTDNVQAAYESEDSDYDAESAGRDFWYTRNGHGVGFWDRDLGDTGDALSEACGHGTAFGTVDVYLGDDNQIHLG